MTSRLRSKYYRRRKLFVADLRSIISNCKLFNEPDSEYYKCAVELEEFVDDLLKDKETDDWLPFKESRGQRRKGPCPQSR